jgi:hypothetical protein
MNEKDQIHTLLTDLAGQDPPVDIDLDRQIERGQARVRRRTVTLCVAAVAVSAVAVGGIVTFRPDANGSDAPAAGPSTPTAPVTLPDGTTVTPLQSGQPPSLGPASSGSTEKSRALLTQFRSLAPELTRTPDARIFDEQEIGRTGEGPIHAGYDWVWPADANQVTVAVDVGRRGTVPPVCDGRTGPNRCTEVRKLPDGSTAYLNAYTPPGTFGHCYDVRLDRADGFSITVSSAAYKLKGAKHDAPLSLKRVLEIAQKITVKPGN